MKVIFSILVFMMSCTLLAQDWEPSYDDALARTATEDKPMLLVFAGSDWCAPCIRLDREIWASEEFIEYAKKNFVLYRADFPRKKKNQLSEELSALHNKLADKFNPNGHFPLVVILDSEQQVLGRTSYKKITPKAYISHLNSLIE